MTHFSPIPLSCLISLLVFVLSSPLVSPSPRKYNTANICQTVLFPKMDELYTSRFIGAIPISDIKRAEITSIDGYSLERFEVFENRGKSLWVLSVLCQYLSYFERKSWWGVTFATSETSSKKRSSPVALAKYCGNALIQEYSLNSPNLRKYMHKWPTVPPAGIKRETSSAWYGAEYRDGSITTI